MNPVTLQMIADQKHKDLLREAARYRSIEQAEREHHSKLGNFLQSARNNLTGMLQKLKFQPKPVPCEG